ncbi:MAG: T9SS type A sorting domain-containing protein [Bacteroidales bacterium]|nr:T9SS type A sorting domain-containing protein [Bacteroidales bacterium]
MKRIKIIFALMLGLVYIAPAQTTFYKQYDLNQGSAGYSLQPIDDGGAMIVGSTTVEGQGKQMLIMKTNETGDTLWTKTYGGEGDDHLECIRNTSDGNFIVSGFAYYQSYVAKINTTGDTLWTFQKEGNSVKSVVQTFDENYAIVRNSSTIKIDSYGEELWLKDFSIEGEFNNIVELEDNSLIYVGNEEVEPFYRINLVKMDQTGNVIWEKIEVGYFGHKAYEAQISLDNNIYIGGSNFGGNYAQPLLMKVDTSGQVVFWKTYENDEPFQSSIFYSLIQLNDSSTVMTGRMGESNGSPSPFVQKTNQEGDLLWMDTYPILESSSEGYCVRQSGEEHLMVTGRSVPWAGSLTKLIFLKTNMDGAITSSPSPLAKEALKVYPNPAGKKVTFICTLANGIHEGILELRNTAGVLIKRITLKKLNGEKTISTNRWAPGIYFYTLRTARGVVTGKLILAR